MMEEKRVSQIINTKRCSEHTNQILCLNFGGKSNASEVKLTLVILC